MGRSPADPFCVKDFWPRAEPGDVLVLLDGLYQGPSSMVNPPAGLCGQAGAPITIRAMNDGRVRIDGQGRHVPVRLEGNDYLVIEGMDACDSSTTVVQLSNSNYCEIKRVCAWDAGAVGNNAIFGVHYGQYNLLEDCAGWGLARKTFTCSQEGNYTTFRRCWGRWEGSHVIGCKTTFEWAYNSYNNIMENCIGTWDTSTGKMQETYVLQDYYGNEIGPTYSDYGVNSAYGIFTGGGYYEGWSHVANCRLLGCIAYTLPITTRISFGSDTGLFFVTKVDSLNIEESAAYSSQDDLRPFALYSQNAPDVAENVYLTRCTGIGARDSLVHSVWHTTDNLLTSTASGILAPVGGLGATIDKRYVDGVLTADDLWPWPMDDRIYDAMVEAGYSQPVHVTQTIGELGVDLVMEQPPAAPASRPAR